jgi:hypothetical protein
MLHNLLNIHKEKDIIKIKNIKKNKILNKFGL